MGDGVREHAHPVVVGRDDDEPPTARQPAQEVEDDADVVGIEMRGRLVGQQQRRVVHERPGERDPLLLPAGQGAGPVVGPGGQPELARRRPAVARAARRGVPVSTSGAMTFSSAVRLGIRLNAWNTMPTVRWPSIGRPPRVTVPVAGVSWPARTDRTVVLPHPLGPRSATQLAVPRPQVHALEGPDHVAAGPVLHAEVVHDQVGALVHVAMIPSQVPDCDCFVHLSPVSHARVRR